MRRCGPCRGVASKFGTNRSSLLVRLTGKVPVCASCGPPTVLSTEEEITISALLAYVVSHYLNVTIRELKEGILKLYSDGRNAPCDPIRGLGPKWMKASITHRPRLTSRSSRTYEANCVTSGERSYMENFYNILGAFVATKKELSVSTRAIS